MASTVVELSPIPRRTWMTLFMIMLVLPLITSVLILYAAAADGGQSEQSVTWIVVAVWLGHIVLLLALLWLLRRNEVTLDGQTLRIRATGMFHKNVPVSAIDWSGARVVASNDPQVGLRWRTMGASLPGYQSGHFRLRNKQKAFALVIDHQAVYLPLKDGAAVIFSPRDASAWLRRHNLAQP